MKRNIITIDEEKCIGCGLCVNACEQDALQLIDGKAKLLSESYCDGLGKCLPKCPTDAMKIEEKEVKEFNNVREDKKMGNDKLGTVSCGCGGSHAAEIKREPKKVALKPLGLPAQSIGAESELMQWPCQIKLVPVDAPYFDGAKLLIAADCTAFANANIHEKFMKGKITLIGCPKLDEGDYAEKLTAIIKNNDIKSVDLLRMSVPCCGGIENALKQALINSGKMIPWSINVVATDGSIVD